MVLHGVRGKKQGQPNGDILPPAIAAAGPRQVASHALARPVNFVAGYAAASSRYTEARPIPSLLAIADAPWPALLSCLTRSASIEGGTAPVHASRLGLCDAFELTLAPEICLELSEYGEHAEKSLTARIAGVDVGIQHPQRGALLGEQIDDAHEIADRPRQAVELRYRQDVSSVEEVENGLELVAAFHLRAAALLRADDGATGSAERFLLDAEVLVR